MGLAELLAVQLGPVLAKLLVGVWLGNGNIADNYVSEAGTDTIGILNQFITDRIQQKRAGRRLEETGEDVARSLLPLFESEGNTLTASESESVVNVLISVLTDTQIDSALIVHNNVDPSRIAVILNELATKKSAGLSEPQLQLLRRSLSHCATVLTGIASRMPRFSESAFGEVLKRLEEIRDDVLTGIERIQNDAMRLNPNSVAVARFEQDYSRNVIDKLGRLELVGLDDVDHAYALEIAFVSLRVRRSLGIVLGDIEAGDLGSFQISDALVRSTRALIRGEPGAGKTTLLQWLAVRSANRTLINEISTWGRLVPFFVRLRKYSDAVLPRPEQWLSEIADSIAGDMPAGWVHHLLRSGRALVLVDGVDELPTESLPVVRNWLRDLVQNYPDSRFVITSRGYAIEQNWLEDLDFDSLELQPMDQAQIHLFIDRWHEAILRQTLNKAEASNIGRRCRDMHASVSHDSAVSRLAINPLLCAVLCELNRQRRGDLPGRRVDLYEKACSMLLYSRDRRRRVSLSQYPQLTYEERSVLLEHLAYWMLFNSVRETSRNEAEGVISDALRWLSSPTARNAAPSEVYRLLVERSGIVQEPSVNTFSFVHLTFQEYFAAKYIKDRQYYRAMVKSAHEQRWHEVIPIVAALADAPGQGILIGGLLTRGNQSKKNHQVMGFLALACAGSCVTLDPLMYSEVHSYASQMTLPDNFEDARRWSKGGYLAIQHLTVESQKKRSHVDTELLYTAPALFEQIETIRKPVEPSRKMDGFMENSIRALAMIGGPEALKEIERYVEQHSDMTSDALSWAWQFFDQSDYLQRIMTKSKALQVPRVVDGRRTSNRQSTHVLQSYIDIDLIASLSQLQILRIEDCSDLVDLSPLSTLHNLTSISLEQCAGISDLSLLTGLERLTDAKVLGCSSKLRELSYLQQLVNRVYIEITINIEQPQSMGDDLEIRRSLGSGYYVRKVSDQIQVTSVTDRDYLFSEALLIVHEYGRISVSLLQRKLRIGYSRAARLVDQLEMFGDLEGIRRDTPVHGQDEDITISSSSGSTRHTHMPVTPVNTTVQGDNDFMPAAIYLLHQNNGISINLLQRKLHIGFSTAANLVEQLVSLGLVGPAEGTFYPLLTSPVEIGHDV